MSIDFSNTLQSQKISATPVSPLQQQATQNSVSTPAISTKSTATLHLLQKRRNLLKTKGWIDDNGLVNRNKEWPVLQALPKSVWQKVYAWFTEQKDFISRNDQFEFNFPNGLIAFFKRLDAEVEKNELTPTAINIVGGYLIKILLNSPDFFLPFLTSLSLAEDEIKEQWLLSLGEPQTPPPLDLDMQYWIPLKIEIKEGKVVHNLDCQKFNKIAFSIISNFAEFSSLPSSDERVYQVNQGGFEKLRLTARKSLYYYVATLKNKQPTPHFFEFLLFGLDSPLKQDYFLRQTLRLNVRNLWCAIKTNSPLPELTLSAFNTDDPLDIYQALFDQFLGYERAVKVTDLDLHLLTRAIYDNTQGYSPDTSISNAFRTHLSDLNSDERTQILQTKVAKIHNDHQRHFPEGAYTFLLQCQLAMGPEFDQEAASLWKSIILPQAVVKKSASPSSAKGKRNFFNECLESPSSSLLGNFCKETQKNFFDYDCLKAFFGSLMPLFLTSDVNNFPLRLIEENKIWVARWTLAIEAHPDGNTYASSVDFTLDPVDSVKALQLIFNKQKKLQHSFVKLIQQFLARLTCLFTTKAIDHSGWCDWKALRLASQELLGHNNRTLRKLGAYLILLCYKAERTYEGAFGFIALLPQLVTCLTQDDLAAFSQMALKEFIRPPLQLPEKIISPLLQSLSSKNETNFETLLISTRQAELCAVALQIAFEQNSTTCYQVFKEAALIIPEKVLTYDLKHKFSLTEREGILSHAAFAIAPDSTFIRNFEGNFEELAKEGLSRCHSFNEFSPGGMLVLTKQVAAKGEIFSALFLFLGALEIKLLNLSDTMTAETLTQLCELASNTLQASTVSAFWLTCYKTSSPKSKIKETTLPQIERMLHSLLAEKSRGAYEDALTLCHHICLDQPKAVNKSKLLINSVIEASIQYSSDWGLKQVSRYPKLPLHSDVKWTLLENEIKRALAKKQWGKVRGHIQRIKDFKHLPVKIGDIYACILALMPLKELLAGILDTVPEFVEVSAPLAKQWLQSQDALDAKDMANVLSFLINRMSVNKPGPIGEYLSALTRHLESTCLSPKLKNELGNKLSLLLNFEEYANLSWQLLGLVHTAIPKHCLSPNQITKLFTSFTARLQQDGFSKEDEFTLRSMCKQQTDSAILQDCDTMLKSLFLNLEKNEQWTLLRQWLIWRLKWGTPFEPISYLTLLARKNIKEFVLLHDAIVTFATKTLYHPPASNQLWVLLYEEKPTEKESKKPNENSHAFHLFQTLFIELYNSSIREALRFLEHLDPRIRTQSPRFWKVACQEVLYSYFNDPTTNTQGHKSLCDLVKLMDTFGDCSARNWKTVANRLQADPNPQVRTYILSILSRRTYEIPKQLAAKMTCEEFDLFTQKFLAEPAMIYAMLVTVGQREELRNLRSYPPDWSKTFLNIICASYRQEPQSPELVKAIAMWHFERLHQIETSIDPSNIDAFEKECLERELQYVKQNFKLKDYFLKNSLEIIERFFKAASLAEKTDPGAQHEHYYTFSHLLIHCLEASFEFEPRTDIRDALISALQAAGEVGLPYGTISFAFETAWKKEGLSRQHQIQKLEICLACFAILLNAPILFTLGLPQRTFSQYFFPLLSAALEELPFITPAINLCMDYLVHLDPIITPENKAIVLAKYMEKSLKKAIEKPIKERKDAIENVIEVAKSLMPLISEDFNNLNNCLMKILDTVCDYNLFTIAELTKHFTTFTNLYYYYPQASHIHPECNIPQKFVIQGNIIRYLMQLVVAEPTDNTHAPFIWAAQELASLIDEYHEPCSKQFYENLFDEFILIRWIRDKNNLTLRELHHAQAGIITKKLQTWDLFEIPEANKLLWSPYVDTLGKADPKNHEVQTYAVLLTSFWQNELNANPPKLVSIYDCICCLQLNQSLFGHYPQCYALLLKEIFKVLQTHCQHINDQQLTFFHQRLRSLSPLTNGTANRTKIYKDYSKCLIANIQSFLNFSFTERRSRSILALLHDFCFTFEQFIITALDKVSCANKSKALLESIFNLFFKSKYELELLGWAAPLFRCLELWLIHWKEEHSYAFTLCKQLIQHIVKYCVITADKTAELVIQIPKGFQKSEIEELGKMLLKNQALRSAKPRPKKQNSKRGARK